MISTECCWASVWDCVLRGIGWQWLFSIPFPLSPFAPPVFFLPSLASLPTAIAVVVVVAFVAFSPDPPLPFRHPLLPPPLPPPPAGRSNRGYRYIFRNTDSELHELWFWFWFSLKWNQYKQVHGSDMEAVGREGMPAHRKPDQKTNIFSCKWYVAVYLSGCIAYSCRNGHKDRYEKSLAFTYNKACNKTKKYGRFPNKIIEIFSISGYKPCCRPRFVQCLYYIHAHHHMSRYKW